MSQGFIPPHGGYRNLLSYQKAEIVYDATAYGIGRARFPWVRRRPRRLVRMNRRNASHCTSLKEGRAFRP
ncbi:MAG: hypothetical protein ACJ759_01430, partial [Thermoanaerobaculia bacterium]